MVGGATGPEPEGEVDLPDDAIVVRFRPTDPERVLASAQKESRRTGHHRLSVFADTKRSGEDDQDVIQRLLDASELAGVDPSRNRRFYRCAAAAELKALNFAFYKDEDDDELAEHYSVDLGEDPTVDDAARFLSVFGPQGGEQR